MESWCNFSHIYQSRCDDWFWLSSWEDLILTKRQSSGWTVRTFSGRVNSWGRNISSFGEGSTFWQQSRQKGIWGKCNAVFVCLPLLLMVNESTPLLLLLPSLRLGLSPFSLSILTEDKYFSRTHLSHQYQTENLRHLASWPSSSRYPTHLPCLKG